MGGVWKGAYAKGKRITDIVCSEPGGMDALADDARVIVFLFMDDGSMCEIYCRGWLGISFWNPDEGMNREAVLRREANSGRNVTLDTGAG